MNADRGPNGSTFRASTSKRAEAIMAALKVSYSSERVLPAASEELGPGGRPISLLNLLLALEGLPFFYSLHASRRQT